MINKRLIPVLLLRNNGLVKTLKFNNSVYIGDPINAVKIFNEKLVDELIFLDIDATKENRKPNINLIHEIATECFMPFSYGGGINNLDDISDIIKAGAEKVIINEAALSNDKLIREASIKFGSSTIIVSIDVKTPFFSNSPCVYSNNGKRCWKINPVDHARNMEQKGAGEIFINSILLDGTMNGYDLELINEISSNIKIPVVACGGAGNLSHISEAIKKTKVSGLGAGSLFSFYKSRKAVLINYPNRDELKDHRIN